MRICQWCGEVHGADRLCKRAQRGMTRRSFCFLFGAGVGAMALGVGSTLEPPDPDWFEPPYRLGRHRLITISDELIRDSSFNAEEVMIRGLRDFQMNISGYWNP